MHILQAQLTATPAPQYDLESGVFSFTIQPSVGYYYAFESINDLGKAYDPANPTDPANPYQTLKLSLGDNAGNTPTFTYQMMPGELARFFRVEYISVFAPRDSDGDGMDDLYELSHGLNPLDATDAGKPSPNIAGLTNLGEYLLIRGYNNTYKPQYYSREVSVFNFGAPTGSLEAISREQSVFNFGSAPFRTEALSREVSVFNGERVPIQGYPQVYSREVSIYNFGAPPFSRQAYSREVSVFNGQKPPVAGYPQFYSREVSIFNIGAPINRTEAISREVSVQLIINQK